MFSTMVLPPDLVADDVIGLRDQMSGRLAAVLRPKGGKRKEGDPPLPGGVEPLAALPPHIDRPRIQWTAMVQRMKTLKEERAQAVIEGFGGTRHYRQLVAADARFGEAYGFTTVVLAREGGLGQTDGRPQWSAARDALRSLIQKIESHADPEIPGSEALAAFLLAPYVEMVDDLARSRRKAPARKPEAVPARPFGARETP
ncbi:hypothetical protein [Sorangium sp. So ce1000]|uniref:hypothetical protein n=1 Tax=Sorangium sp. So ce1000 TaxID=3133325 RepID=UPI003F5DCE54